MSAGTQHLTIEQFRNIYGETKPYYEYWGGAAIQKAVPTKLHSKLQKLLANVLAELGFHSFTELTLRIDPTWEPIPDVAATVEDFDGPYPTAPVDVVAEVLSPQDTFTLVEEKCERYAAAGVTDILVFDPVDRKAWKWDKTLGGLIRTSGEFMRLDSKRSAIDMETLWARFGSEL
jgi:Uma2 family endonuclease